MQQRTVEQDLVWITVDDQHDLSRWGKDEDPRQVPAVGRSVPRPDTLSQVLGELKYIGDLTFPGMLYAKVLRSRHAHARVLHVDTSRAEAVPGVVVTLTAQDVPVNSFGPTFQDQPVLVGEKVRHMGDGVAAVAAINEQIAEEALDKIEVEYQPLPAIFDPLEAMKDGAPRIHAERDNTYWQWHIRQGNVEEALALCPMVVEEHYTTQSVEHMPLETHSSIAMWDARGRVTVWSTLGRIALGRTDLARILQVPVNKVRVVSTQVAGNFGGKNEITLDPIVALLAKKAGRPVKGTFTRKEEFIASTVRHPFIMDYLSGVAEDGRILARKVRLVADGGAYCSWSETTLGKATILSAGPYNIPNITLDGYVVYTNKTVAGAMRGFGAPQVCFAYESHMDSIARRLGMDPLQIRLLNGYDEGSVSSTGQVLQSVALKKTLLAAAERFGWEDQKR